jgi:iron-sulfur cluster assembly protein
LTISYDVDMIGQVLSGKILRLELIMEMTETTTQTEQVSLTPPAAQAVIDLMADRNLQGYSLRVFVQGGGCSGFQYGLALDNNIRVNDLVYEEHGVKVIVDEVSIKYMAGATVDYVVNEETGSGFKIHNPNPISSCGCGQTSGESSSCGGGCCGD